MGRASELESTWSGCDVGGGRAALVVKMCPAEGQTASGLACAPPSALHKTVGLELPPHVITACSFSPSLNMTAKPQNSGLCRPLGKLRQGCHLICRASQRLAGAT